MRFSSQRNAQHHVIMISDLLVTVNGLWMWLFAALAIRFLNILFCCRDGLKVKDQRPKQRGNNSPVWAKGGSNQNGKLQGGTSKRRTNKLNSKEANHIQSFFYFFYLLPWIYILLRIPTLSSLCSAQVWCLGERSDPELHQVLAKNGPIFFSWWHSGDSGDTSAILRYCKLT